MTNKKLVVQSVTGNSIAEKAGVRKGDVLVSLDGRSLFTSEDLTYAMNQASEAARLSYIQNGEEVTAVIPKGKMGLTVLSEDADEKPACVAANEPPLQKSKDDPKKDSSKKKPGLIVQIVCYGLAAFIMISIFGGSKDRSSKSERGPDSISALTECQMFIKKISKNPSVADVPYTRDSSAVTSPDFIFTWDMSDPIMLQNGFGAMIAHTGTCKVKKSNEQITSLVLNGKKIL